MSTIHAPLTRRTLLLAGASLCATAPSSWAATPAWPSKPVRIIVPYPAGGVNDVVARMLGELMSQAFHQPVVIDNKPGAGGTMGMAELAKADDQHTFAFAAISPLTLNPYLMKVAYDPLTDIHPVASVMYAPVYLMATPSFRGKRFEDVIAQSKTSKGVSIATSGYGTLAHIMVEQLIRATGGRFVHVPYKGGTQLITDAAGGQFDLLLANPFAPINALIEQGKLRVLATTGPHRAGAFSQTPTLGELGFEKANLTSLFGFYTAKHTDAAVVHHFNALVNQLLGRKAVQERLRMLDNVPRPMSSEAFTALVRKDYALNGVIIEQADIKAQ